MNLGLVTSYIIAGMLMIAVIMMNINLSSSSTELTLTQTTKQHVQTITDMITYDIPKIGFAMNDKVTADIYDHPISGKYRMIEVADSNRIVFNSDIDNDGTIEKVTWQFTTNAVTTSENPDDYILLRKVGTDETEITLGVTHFRIRYYDLYGEPQAGKMSTPVASADLESIRQIEIKLVVQSRQKVRYNVNSDGRYVTSAWEKRFTPRNLQ